MYEVTERDGAARTGLLTLGDKSVATPSLLLIEHERFRVDLPDRTTLFSLSVNDDQPTVEGNRISDIREIHRGDKVSGEPGNAAHRFIKSRDNAGYSKALYLPGTGTIRDYAQMIYSGVDLLDASQLILQARKGNYLTAEGAISKMNWTHEKCFCPACIGGKNDFTSLLLHNILCALGELATIKHFIRTGMLRHLVEMRIRSHPETVSIQRVLDRDHYSFFQKRIPFTGSRILGVSEQILNEPRVRSYQEKLADYRKPGGEVLLLLPCSARKPYSISKSHRLIHEVTGYYPGMVHEVIVTSPLGLVPRELENFHPAANYDVSVTGEWSLDEERMIRRMLATFLQNNSYSQLINHTPYGFVSEFLKEIFSGTDPCIPVIDTVRGGKVTSNESLRNLDKVLEQTSGSMNSLRPDTWKERVFANMWRFQFGKDSESVLEGTKVRGRFPFFKLFGENGQVGMMVPKSMRISLTLGGAELLATLGRNRVFIGDFIPSGDIFAVGITGADPGIRVGDEVAVVHGTHEGSDTEIRGVGVAVMNCDEMVESNRGVGVKLRHRIKR